MSVIDANLVLSIITDSHAESVMPATDASLVSSTVAAATWRFQFLTSTPVSCLWPSPPATLRSSCYSSPRQLIKLGDFELTESMERTHITRKNNGGSHRQGWQVIARLQREHEVMIEVPRLEDPPADVVAVSGQLVAVEACRVALESLLALPMNMQTLPTASCGVPRKTYSTFIGDKGATLRWLMSSCRVVVEVPRGDAPGEVSVRGRQPDVLRAKAAIEEIVRDSVPRLPSEAGDALEISMPPSYDVATSEPIRRFLDSARVTCDVCVFTITDTRIARILLEAHRHRGGLGDGHARVLLDQAFGDTFTDMGEGLQARVGVGSMALQRGRPPALPLAAWRSSVVGRQHGRRQHGASAWSDASMIVGSMAFQRGRYLFVIVSPTP